MKIYTRVGDDGSTSLLGPGRVRKSVPRVEAYGSVDELNASLGVARSLDHDERLAEALGPIQSQLFNLGAELATTTPSMMAALKRLGGGEVEALEGWIDRLEDDLPNLTRFILPGGSPLAAQLHWSRTVCRRAERRLVALAEVEAIEPLLISYLNRLGDLLFVMARWCNRRDGVAETEWHSGHRGEPAPDDGSGQPPRSRR
jgi:cob(I)alamin adenosyltransferase